MSRIYVASSWRNMTQQSLVKELRKRGHLVYDFRHPEGRNDHNVWESVSSRNGLKSAYQQNALTPENFEAMLQDKKAIERFKEHSEAMSDADTCILLVPCGRSAHCEAGWMSGQGKRVFVLDVGSTAKPELMYLLFDGYTFKVEDIYKWVDEPILGVCRVCGCTEENPCYHPEYGNCFWVDDECTLCSHCASKKEGGLGIKDDPLTEHCFNDIGTAFKERKEVLK